MELIKLANVVKGMNKQGFTIDNEVNIFINKINNLLIDEGIKSYESLDEEWLLANDNVHKGMINLFDQLYDLFNLHIIEWNNDQELYDFLESLNLLSVKAFFLGRNPSGGDFLHRLGTIESIQDILKIALTSKKFKWAIRKYNYFKNIKNIDINNFYTLLNEVDLSNDDITSLLNDLSLEDLNILKTNTVKFDEEDKQIISRSCKDLKEIVNALTYINEHYYEASTKENMKECLQHLHNFISNETLIKYINENLESDILSIHKYLIENVSQQDVLDSFEEKFKGQVENANSVLNGLREASYSIVDLLEILHSFNGLTKDGQILFACIDKINKRIQGYNESFSKYLDLEHNFGVSKDLILYKKDIENVVRNRIIDLEYEAFLKRYQKHFMELNNIDEVKQKELVKNFLQIEESFPEINSTQDTPFVLNYTFQHTIGEIYDFIKNDKQIVANIALSENILLQFKNLSSKGDYTMCVASQIKTVERLIKEILVQRFYDDIWMSKNGTYCWKYNYRNRNTLTSACLSKNKEVIDGNKTISMELGPAACALSFVLCNVQTREIDDGIFEHTKNPNSTYHGIFELVPDPRNRNTSADKLAFEAMNSKFYKNFISGVRNGYFHIDVINNIDDAIAISKTTAYWMARTIDEIISFDESFKLKIHELEN